MELLVLADELAVCRLNPQDAVPENVLRSEFYSLTRTKDELSVVCPARDAPEGIVIEKGWAALMVKGPLDFNLTGILSSIAKPLAAARISIFALSTFDTDYVLVQREQLTQSIAELRRAGFVVHGDDL